jgi:hypothetical protein
MPYCPQCRIEYRLGFSECADCHVALVSTLPAPPLTSEDTGPDYARFVAVLDTTDNFALNAAIGLLEEDEIPYVIDNEPSGVSREILTAKHNWWIPACRILVSPECEKEARKLLETFASPDLLDGPQGSGD